MKYFIGALILFITFFSNTRGADALIQAPIIYINPVKTFLKVFISGTIIKSIFKKKKEPPKD